MFPGITISTIYYFRKIFATGPSIATGGRVVDTAFAPALDGNAVPKQLTNWPLPHPSFSFVGTVFLFLPFHEQLCPKK